MPGRRQAATVSLVLVGLVALMRARTRARSTAPALPPGSSPSSATSPPQSVPTLRHGAASTLGRRPRLRKVAAVTLVLVGLAALTGAAKTRPVSAEPAAAQPAPSTPPERPLPQPNQTREPGLEVPAADGDAAEDMSPELVPIGSARLEDRVIADKPRPVGVRIDAIDIAAPIEPAGALAGGEMEVPHDVTTVAWYRYGPTPGEPGSAVLAAHVDLAGRGPGVFYALRTLERGDEIAISFDDGSTMRFVVVDGAVYDKSELDTQRIFARSGMPTLTLITCGGGFNPSLRRYDSNVVVYAAPAPEKTEARR